MKMEIKVVRQILEWNEDCHKELQQLFNEKKVLVLNVMGSPGGGKTTFITRVIEILKPEYNIGVIEADIAGQIDAEKIGAMGIPVVQLNTDGACHTEAMSIKNMLPYFDLDKLDILIIENIGNLVCPAEFDIGEDLKISLLSVPEGDDKVEKYPLMFTRSNALIITKYDMKEYFNFNDNRVIENSKKLNDSINIFKVNSAKGEGLNEVIDYIKSYIKR
jgi:hydrogenase nickel incorporation protein HypB